MPWFSKEPAKPAPGTPAIKPPAVKISSLLTARSIIVAGAGKGRWDVLSELVGVVCAAHTLGDSAPFLEKVRERENGISTTLDTGLSLPHARIDGLARLAAGLAVAPVPLSDPKQPDLPTRAMLLFFSPNRQEEFSLHLQVLRSAAALFDASLIERLTRCPDPAAVLAALAAREK